MGSIPAPWFVVLPDRDIPPHVVTRLAASQVLTHPSGRPWLAGRWSPDEMTVHTDGPVRLAVAGTCSLTAAQLAVRAERVEEVTDIESALTGAHGSFHVIASVAGHTYVRGSHSGQRRLYRAELDGGGTVCADRALPLARLTGAGLDTAQLALSLAGGTLPHPLAEGALWRGVHTVLPGHAVELDPDGRVRITAWWRPPARELPLAEAAAGLREALRQAVALRVRPGEVAGADLSGGMDSTSLAFLAAEAGARLVAVTLDWKAPHDQDRDHAAHAARHLPGGVEHLVFPSADLPAHFSGLDERDDPTDEPTAALRDRGRQRFLTGVLRERGARWRLSGHGGDHVVQPPPAYVHGLLRHSLAAGLRHAAGLRARHRRPLGATARDLLDRRPYGTWLAEAAVHLTEPGAGIPFGWGTRPQLPPWASGQAVELCRYRLRAAAREAEPLHRERGRHAWIGAMRQAGRIAGHLAHHTARAGLPVHSPFCDDAVLDAVLAARPYEAATPWSYKPLLAAAMDGLVPARVLHRTTRDHCGLAWQEGLRLHRAALASWAETSRLVAAGVVDEEPLRRALLSPGTLTGGAGELEVTLGAEAWLRDLEDARERHVAPTAH